MAVEVQKAETSYALPHIQHHVTWTHLSPQWPLQIQNKSR